MASANPKWVRARQRAGVFFNTRWHRIFGPAADANTTAPASHEAAHTGFVYPVVVLANRFNPNCITSKR